MFYKNIKLLIAFWALTNTFVVLNNPLVAHVSSGYMIKFRSIFSKTDNFLKVWLRVLFHHSICSYFSNLQHPLSNSIANIGNHKTRDELLFVSEQCSL